ncbi:MAG TPA: ComEC/Rec2 family competence protein [Kineosporiaceae bacterium]|nr:ComEC/Rec2 family competence protein [Kineosporiaceae bacterium]
MTGSADLRLLPAAVSAWAAAFWATGAPVGLVAVLAVVATLAALGCGVAAARRGLLGRSLPARTLGAVALAAAAVAVVLASTAGALAARSAGTWPRWVEERAVTRLEGTATSDARRLPEGGRGQGDRYVVDVDVDAAQARGSRQELELPVVVLASASWRTVSAGQGVTWTGRLGTADAGDAAAAVVTALGPPVVVPGSWSWRVADRVRAALRDACVGLPEDAGGLLPSLVDGDGSRLPETLRADLTTAGLTHLTAVSGANLSIIAESALWVAGAIGAPRRLRVVLLLLTLAGFVVLARPSPSVLRAAAMGGVGVTAAALSRRGRAVPALAAAAVALLGFDPYLARSAGFALSVVATGGLLLLAPVWAEGLGRWLPRPLALAVAAPAAAQVACGPVLVLLQPAVSLVAVPANLLAEPVVAPATVLGVVAAVVGTVALPAAHLVAVVAALGTGWIAGVAHHAASLPLASVPWPAGVGGAVLLAALEAVVVVLTVPALRAALPWMSGARVRSAAAPGPSPSRRRFLLGAAGAVAGLAGLAAAGVRPPRLPSGGVPDDWSVAMADVGQGDATLLRTGTAHAVLVDTGPDPDLVDAALRRFGVRHLDLVVLTHFHADHVGGLAGALAGRTVGAILVSPLEEPPANAAEVRRVAAAAGVPVVAATPARAGLAGRDGWRVAWRVLAPFGAAVPLTAPETDDSDVVNEASVAVVAELTGPVGSARAVLLGDLESQGQRALAERLAAGLDGLGGPVDVVKVAHHGSAKQHESLYRAIDARVALIGVGAGNDYGHPAPSALALLRRAGLTVLRTDNSGDLAVAARPDGGLRLATSRS